MPPIREKEPTLRKVEVEEETDLCTDMLQENNENAAETTNLKNTGGYEEKKQDQDADEKNSTGSHGLWYQDENNKENTEDGEEKQNQTAFNVDDFLLNANNNNNGDGDTEDENQEGRETTGKKTIVCATATLDQEIMNTSLGSTCDTP